MKTIILLFVLPILIGISNVSADETGTGSNDTGTGIINTSPVAVDDTVTISEDTSVEIDLTSNDTDAESDALTVTSILNMLNGTGTINGSGTGVTFTPDSEFNGTGSFDYVVSDGELTDTGSVVISISAVNDAPVAEDDSISIDEDTQVEIDLTSNDTDVDGDSLIVTEIGTILNGEGEINSAGTGVIFTPDSGFKGLVSFTYTVSDGDLSDTGNVLVSVNEENSSPEAEDDTLIVDENSSETIDPRENDSDANGDVLDITGVSDGTHGTVTYTSVSVTYIPDEDYYGSDRFSYTISDGNGGTDTGIVRVTVNRINDDDDDDDDDDDNDDDGNKFRERHMVQAVQKEYIGKFKHLKNQYRWGMGNKNSRNTYLRLKAELRDEYLAQLKAVTGQGKKYSYEGDTKKNNYKKNYEKKYGKTISKMSDSRLETLLGKIDDLIAEVNESSTYSDSTKTKFNTMLLALREIVVEYMNNTEDVLDIDSLFE